MNTLWSLSQLFGQGISGALCLKYVLEMIMQALDRHVAMASMNGTWQEKNQNSDFENMDPKREPLFLCLMKELKLILIRLNII